MVVDSANPVAMPRLGHAGAKKGKSQSGQNQIFHGNPP
jgi:hypothetical protein